MRSDQGPWQYFDLEQLGPGRGDPWTLLESEEDELREFLGAIEDARVPGRIAWALDRFELGCERRRDAEALSDFLMALRALLDASDEPGRASLSLRLAALCAEEPDRRSVQRRTETAFALERFLMGGGERGRVRRRGRDRFARRGHGRGRGLRARPAARHPLRLPRGRTCGAPRTTSCSPRARPVEIEARDIRDEQPTEDP